MSIRNRVQLITYPDSLGGDLKSLHDLLEKHFLDIFPGGIHLLPPFPSSGDRGFAPMTYFEIDPRFGGWEDVRRIGKQFPILVDIMVNHISRQSAYFQDFIRRGRRSDFADLFITLDKIWPGGSVPKEDLAKIFLRRPETPFTDIVVEETGKMERVWATFGTRDWSEQIDLDVRSPLTQKLFSDILAFLSRQGVRMVRLDAIAYVTKQAGTSCFFVEPDIYTFIDWMRAQADAVGIEILPEVHARYDLQQKLAEHGCWVYNFVMPLLVLHTLTNRSSAALKNHLRRCPRRQFIMLDCHDGIPVQPDLDGILDVEAMQRVVQVCLDHGANISPIYSASHRINPVFDAHQINCTYYSALGEDDDAYLAARAIQFFAPGVPQVYYVGFLAGENNPTEVERTGERRAINRHNYTLHEVERALEKPVVRRLSELIRFRNETDAFDGEFDVLETDDRRLALSWQKGESRCVLTIDLETSHTSVEYTGVGGTVRQYRP